MISFNVGPSQISDFIKEEICKLAKSDILSISHRSKDFTNISSKVVGGLKKFYNIPEDYKIFYLDSATMAMDLSIRNLCEKKSFHFVNGNFSENFYQISKSYKKEICKDEVSWGNQNDYKSVIIPNDVDFITITHNETSTGVTCKSKDIEYVREQNKDKILTVDVTSSAGVYDFDMSQADVWIFSVQKCFGLPAGLGIIILSQKAFERSIELSSRGTNLSGMFTFEAMEKKMGPSLQTIYTPNVFDIYLFGKILEFYNDNGGIENNYKDALKKYSLIENFVNESKDFEFFVEDKDSRSISTICLKGSPENILKVKENCKSNGFALGSGYGKLKESTIRIGNFPAILLKDFERLVGIFSKCS